MLHNPSSDLVGHLSDASTTAPAPSRITMDGAWLFWATISALILNGVPTPRSVTVSVSGRYCDVHVADANDVTTWARALHAPEPTSSRLTLAGDPDRPRVMTETRVALRQGAELSVYHFTSAPLGGDR